jgi:excisionase family DNA binding protein
MVFAMEEVFTVDEVAKRLKVKPKTVRLWLAAGKLRGTRLGSRKTGWRVRNSELERFVDEGPWKGKEERNGG